MSNEDVMSEVPAESHRRALDELIEERGLGHPAEVFRDVSDEFWLWVNTDGRNSPAIKGMIPGLPDAAQQTQWTGKSGLDAQVEAFEIYRELRDLYQRHFGNLRDAGPVLDFGCGWGRVISFFQRDVDPGLLLGTDYDRANLDFCVKSNPWCQFTHNEARPPLSIGDHEVGFIYAYSVFTHFSEPIHEQWLAEYKRILRPGGALALTVRPRGFIENTRRLRAEGSSRITARMFLDVDAELARYDNGEYCFSPYERDSEDAWWGEACIPQAYVEKEWGRLFEVVGFERSRDLKQHVVLLRA